MTIPRILLAASLAGCLGTDAAPPAPPPATSATAAAITDPGVKDVPAVNHGLFPDNVGYLYQGELATVLWMQNQVSPANPAELEVQLRRGMEQGLSGEFIASAMQHLAPITDAQPTLDTMAAHSVQAVRLLAQYAFTADAYARSLGGALATYNEDAARSAAITAAAGRVGTALGAMGTAAPGVPMSAPPPPPNRGPVQPGQYLSDTLRAGQHAYLQNRAHALQRAIERRDEEAYGAAFRDVFYAQLDPTLRDEARAALAVSHVDTVLSGQPFDDLVGQLVLKPPAPDLALTMDELRLINQINLLSNQASVARQPLVAALLLLDEDRQLGEVDAQLSCAAIWAHVQDVDWLIAQYVRVKADGSTPASVLALVNTIIANHTAH